jgi:hypothetical protein
MKKTILALCFLISYSAVAEEFFYNKTCTIYYGYTGTDVDKDIGIGELLKSKGYNPVRQPTYQDPMTGYVAYESGAVFLTFETELKSEDSFYTPFNLSLRVSYSPDHWWKGATVVFSKNGEGWYSAMFREQIKSIYNRDPRPTYSTLAVVKDLLEDLPNCAVATPLPQYIKKDLEKVVQSNRQL